MEAYLGFICRRNETHRLIPTVSKELNTPDLQLHCSSDSCNGVRFFRCTKVFSNPGPHLEENSSNYLYVNVSLIKVGCRVSLPLLTQKGGLKRVYSSKLQFFWRIYRSTRPTDLFSNWRYVTYQCSNCQMTQKVYSLAVMLFTDEQSYEMCCKLGEIPPYGPPFPSRLIKLIDPDRDIFLKGHECENQGLGIGAFTYYRRVVENQKNRILAEIVKVSEKIDVPQDKIDTLREAIQETQFSKSLKMAKDVMPESLLINRQSPILLLHHALSRGVHELSDEECLKLANTVRLVLGELSERLSAVLKDDAELIEAVSTLLRHKSS